MTETTGTPTPKLRSKTTKTGAKKESVAKKAAADPTTAAASVVRKTTPRKTSTSTAKIKQKAAPMSAEERQRLIAEAAYLRAEQRGFIGGDPVQDWMDAEADLDARLKGPTH